jgi:prevent-host-death family protein
MTVRSVNLADARAHLGELVDEAAGVSVSITRRGKAVAQLTGIGIERRRVEPSVLRALTDAMPVQPETAGDFVRRMRDDDRY